MNIWHKRLLSFSIKIFGVVLIIAVIALFLYYQYFFKKDNLIKYIPPQAVIYATFNLDEKLTDNSIIKQLLADLQIRTNDFEILNPFTGYNLALAILPNETNNILTPDYLLVLNLHPNITSLDKMPALEQKLVQKQLKYSILLNKTLERSILIISNSQLVLDQVKKISLKEQPSLVDNINVVVNLKQLDADSEAKIYLDTKKLSLYLQQDKNLSSQLIASSWTDLKINDLFLGLKISQDKIVLQNYKSLNDEKQDLLLKSIPDNYAYYLDFKQAAGLINQLLAKIEIIDSPQYTNLANLRDYFQKIYNFNWQTDILQLFDQQGAIMVDQIGNWLISADLAKIDNIDSRVEKVKQIITQHLAINNPVVREKKLPDGTYIEQIVKQIDNLSYTSQNINNYEYQQIQLNGEEYVSIIDNNKLYFANNSQILLDYLALDTNFTQKPCYIENSNNFSQNAVISSNFIRSFMPNSLDFNELFINESLAENKKIRLCLD